MRAFACAILLSFFVAVPVFAASSTPYVGEASDRSLEATGKAIQFLLSNQASMASWTVEQWQSWADERFGSSNSADGSTWRDWKKARIKSATDHTVLSGLDDLNKPATNWTADNWKTFVLSLPTDYQSPDRYFCVITPSGQDRGKFLLGRWAYAMYEDNLPERQSWESSASEEEGGGSGSGMTSADVELLLKLGQAQLELLCFLAGLMTASIVAITWKW